MLALLGLLKKLKLVPVGIALAIATIFTVGNGYVRIVSPRAAIIIAVIVVFIGLVVSVVQLLLAKKKKEAKKEPAAVAGAPAAPPSAANQDELNEIRKKLAETVAQIRGSKLAKGKGAGIYSTPWYLLLGGKASSKTQLIENAELANPFASASPRSATTRNTDFWLMNECVLVDTTGRYASVKAGEADVAEWREMLELVQKTRSRVPINGLLVCVSLETIVGSSEEHLEILAKSHRERLDEAMKALKVAFPVYLLFTKCDLLEGFSEFFKELRDDELKQPWGASFARSEPQKGRVEEIFDREFKRLHEALKHRRLEKLYRESSEEDRREIYLFPMDFGALRAKLKTFMGTLFASNPFQQDPALRGFYFTSTMQGGGGMTPLEGASMLFNKSMGLKTTLTTAGPAKKGDRVYFVADFFKKVLLPDQHIVAPTRAASAGMGKKKKILAGAIAAGFLVLSTWAIFAFAGNNRIYRDTERVAKSVLLTQVHPRDGRSFWANVSALDALQAQIRKLERRRATIPIVPERWIFAKGKTVEEKAKFVYLAGLQATIFDPLTQDIAVAMQTIDDPRTYRHFRAYVMLTDAGPTCLVPDFLGDYTARNWILEHQPAASTEDLDVVREQIRFLGERREEWPGLGRSPLSRRGNPDLVASSAVRLRETLQADDVLMAAMDDVSSKVEPFRPADPLIASQTMVRGAYTKEGWDHVRELIASGGGISAEDCAAQKIFPQGIPALGSGMARRYFQEYRAEWSEFLKGLDLKRMATAEEAQAAVQKLADPGSPTVELLRGVVDRAILPEDGEFRDDIRSVNQYFGTISAFVPPKGLLDQGKEAAGQGGGGTEPHEEYTGQILVGILGLLQSTDQGGGENAAAVAREAFAGEGGRGAAIKALDDWVGGFIARNNSGSAEDVRRLLTAPGRAGLDVSLGAAKGFLSDLWLTKVVEPYDQTLAKRYPLDPTSGNDASIAEFEKFFSPNNGTLWGTFEAELSPFVTEEFELKSQNGATLPISSAFLQSLKRAKEITDAMFNSSGKLDCGFQVAPQIYKSGAHVNWTEFKIDDNTEIRYTMGAQQFKPIRWPLQDLSGGKVKISVSVQDQTPPKDVEASGPWGLFRMLDQANKVTPINSQTVEYKWILEPSSKSYTVEVPYRLKADRPVHPFRSQFLKFDCPRSL